MRLPRPISVNNRAGQAWSASDRETLVRLHGSMTIAQLAETLGRTKSAIRGQVTILGIAKTAPWTDRDDAQLLDEYDAHAARGDVSALAARMGRSRQFLCRKARALGLTQYGRSTNYRSEELSQQAKAWHQKNPHPRGYLGNSPSPAARAKISAASIESWSRKSDDERADITLRAMKTRVERAGNLAPNHKRGAWKAGWREIGGVRKYYRSAWEANYARYLQWLKHQGVIADWAHEPETFWFEAIKRGVRSYLPDFRVWENDGSSALHEVKGWMDARSRTTLRRMAKYHPQERIVLVDSKQYAAIAAKVSRLIPGWET